MLRTHLMQHCYSLSDPAIEDELIEIAILNRLTRNDLISAMIPDKTTFLVFKHLLTSSEVRTPTH